MPYRSTLMRAAVTPALLMFLACADAPLPGEIELPDDTYELPAPDPSLDPADIVVGDYIATPCGLNHPDGFEEIEDRHEWATVDVYFGRAGEAGPWDGPTAEDRALVEAHGGRVLHDFGVPAVRARMVLSKIPALIADGFWITVREVPDDTRYDVPLGAGFTRALSDADEALFADLGGRVERRFDFIDALFGPLPDASIEALRSADDVGYVEAETVACTT